MRLARAAGLGFGASCLLLLAVACGNSASNVKNDGDGSSAGKAGSGPDLGGVGDGTEAGSSNSGSGGQCAGNLIEAKRIPLDIYVMLDVSGSMLEATQGDANLSKWQAVSSALTDFVNDKASEGIGVGLQLFPLRHPDAPASCKSNADCGADFGPCFLKTCWNYDGLVPCNTAADCGEFGQFGPCVAFGHCSNNQDYVCQNLGQACSNDPDTNAPLGMCTAAATTECVVTADCRPPGYAAPAAAIATLPEGRAALVETLQTTMPDPGALTPTGPALAGAIQQAKTWARAHADHQVVALLATDGLPTLQTAGQACGAVEFVEDIDAVVNLAGTGRTTAPSVSTFVIGVVGPDDAGAPAILNAIAMAGGSGDAFIVDPAGNVQQEFRDALNQIRATGLSCDLAVPEADVGKTVNFGEVNVDFTNKSGVVEPLANVVDATGCAGMTKGWYYDVPTAPTRITVCPATCTDFQAADMGSVQIRLGCKTRQVVR